jgi:CheY-like chemotaxis protein
MLTHIGYEVTLAVDGNETVDLYRQAFEAGTPFDLVIMDLTIPGGMGGKEAIYKLREIDPAVRAVVSSGYTKDPVMNNYRDFGFVAAIPKPYKINELSNALHTLLSP